MKKNYSVYIHINKINKKSYIGITCQEVNKRWNGGNGYNDQVFGSAIKKYGWSNFEHKVLFKNLSKEDACNKEIELIKKYNSKVPNGYNISNGGETNYKNGLIICINTMDIKDLDELFEEQENMFHCKYDSNDIIKCCENKLPFLLLPWRKEPFYYQYYNNKTTFDKNEIIKKYLNKKNNKYSYLCEKYDCLVIPTLKIGENFCFGCRKIIKNKENKFNKNKKCYCENCVKYNDIFRKCEEMSNNF